MGRYQVAELISAGGLAEVYRVFDTGSGPDCALKVLKPEHCSNEVQKALFISAARITATLDHPNIVSVREVGTLDQAPYIVMERLGDETLADRLLPGIPTTTTETLSLARQIARALDYAHGHGVIHRDIKPANILFALDNTTVKLGDFGIAGSDKHGDPTGVEQLLMATPRYMSPEQARGAAADARSDLFSLGAVLYEMLTGNKAFDADELPALIQQVLQSSPAPMAEIAPDTSVGLQNIVVKLLQKKPAKRFQNARALIAALAAE